MPVNTKTGAQHMRAVNNSASPLMPRKKGMMKEKAVATIAQITRCHHTGRGGTLQYEQKVCGGLLPMGLEAKSRKQLGHADHGCLAFMSAEPLCHGNYCRALQPCRASCTALKPKYSQPGRATRGPLFPMRLCNQNGQ